MHPEFERSYRVFYIMGFIFLFAFAMPVVTWWPLTCNIVTHPHVPQRGEEWGAIIIPPLLGLALWGIFVNGTLWLRRATWLLDHVKPEQMDMVLEIRGARSRHGRSLYALLYPLDPQAAGYSQETLWMMWPSWSCVAGERERVRVYRDPDKPRGVVVIATRRGLLVKYPSHQLMTRR